MIRAAGTHRNLKEVTMSNPRHAERQRGNWFGNVALLVSEWMNCFLVLGLGYVASLP